MDFLAEHVPKSQTIWGFIRFFSSLIAWSTIIIIGFTSKYKDISGFNCDPKPNDFAKQVCYHRYTSEMSSTLAPLTFAGLIAGVLCFLWIVMIAVTFYCRLQIKRGTVDREKEHSRRFWICCVLHAVIEVGFHIIMVVLFCRSQTIRLPPIYSCSLRNDTVQIRISQNTSCSDLYYKQKSDLNIAIIAILVISVLFCILTILHAIWKRDDFVEQFLDWCRTKTDQTARLTYDGEQQTNDVDGKTIQSQRGEQASDEGSNENIRNGEFPKDWLPYLALDITAAGKNKWRAAGKELMKDEWLNHIEVENPNDEYECCYKMLTRWHKSGSGHRYEDLAKALGQCKLNDIRNNYCIMGHEPPTEQESWPIPENLKSGPVRGDFVEIAASIRNIRKRFGRALGLEDDDLETIEENFKGQGVEEKAYQILMKWKQGRPDEATYHRIAQACRDRTVDMAVPKCCLA